MHGLGPPLVTSSRCRSPGRCEEPPAPPHARQELTHPRAVRFAVVGRGGRESDGLGLEPVGLEPANGLRPEIGLCKPAALSQWATGESGGDRTTPRLWIVGGKRPSEYSPAARINR
ncbi:MAG: hypothetical protein ACLQNE_28875 [Thermoguttaceae bacterium]